MFFCKRQTISITSLLFFTAPYETIASFEENRYTKKKRGKNSAGYCKL
jgi:hypothetical protein